MKFKYAILGASLVLVGCTPRPYYTSDAVIVGPAGSSCTVTAQIGGSLITCTDGTSTFVPNGINGADGQDGTSPILEVIRPCGTTGTQSEVLLRLADSRILAHYAGGGNAQFFSILEPGTYTTTGLSGNCTFSIGAAPSYIVTRL